MWLHILSSNIWYMNCALCGVSESYNAQCTVHTHQIELDIRVICSHIAEITLKDIFQLITLMIVTSVL